MINFDESNSRCLILLLNLVILISANGSELTNGNFGATRPGPLPRSIKSRKETTGASKSYPFSGTVESVDPKGQFIILKGKSKTRRILVNSKTKFLKADHPAILADALSGQHVSGAVRKNEAGQEEAITVHIGEKAPADSRKKLPTE